MVGRVISNWPSASGVTPSTGAGGVDTIAVVVDTIDQIPTEEVAFELDIKADGVDVDDLSPDLRGAAVLERAVL